MDIKGGYGLGKKRDESVPLISVITPVFNAEQFIERCIGSVIEQNYPNIEHIILDAGSNDNTISILKAHAENVAFWQSQPDRGIYDAMNKGANIAAGEWLFFLGADDRLEAGFSEMCYALKDINTVYYGNIKIGGKIKGFPYSAFQVAALNIPHQCIFYPKNIFSQYQYNLAYKIRADHDLNIRCFGDKLYKFKYLPYLIAEYAEGGYSSSFVDDAFFKDRDRIILRHLGLLTYLRYKVRRIRHYIKGRKS
ncbi:glycosyltransferase family 2 protein [Nubsella zeaxanthinifaciens]|uniref:glycosyltransferase family 2 protein n=1 Tax=Nubsella zeaxanthinifaciens TaxID=392412 RepID=UPI003D04B172